MAQYYIAFHEPHNSLFANLGGLEHVQNGLFKISSPTFSIVLETKLRTLIADLACPDFDSSIVLDLDLACLMLLVWSNHSVADLSWAWQLSVNICCSTLTLSCCLSAVFVPDLLLNPTSPRSYIWCYCFDPVLFNFTSLSFLSLKPGTHENIGRMVICFSFFLYACLTSKMQRFLKLQIFLYNRIQLQKCCNVLYCNVFFYFQACVLLVFLFLSDEYCTD